MKGMLLGVLFVYLHHVQCKLYSLAESRQQIIAHVNDHYNCDSIILFGKNLDEDDRQWNQQVFVGRKNIKLKAIESFYKMRKPLVVFLDHQENAKFQLIASALDASRPVFILFLNDQTVIEDFFSNIYFSYDYKFIISQKNETNRRQEIISRVQLDHKKKKIVKILFATWSEVTGLKSIVKPDKVLSSYVLRAGLNHNPPITEVKIDEKKLKVVGYLSKLAREFQNQLNIKFTYIFSQEVGVKENGKWGGSMGLLTNNSIDIFFSPLVISLERNEDVDFSLPLSHVNSAIFIRKPDNGFSWTSYFEPFHFTVWSIIISTIFVESIILILFEYFEKLDVSRRLRGRSKKLPKKYVESFLKVHGVVCGQGLEPSNFNSLRVLHLIIHIAALLILTFYSAIFLNIITYPELKFPISSLKDFIDNNNYRLGCIKGPSWNIFKNSDDQIMKKIFNTHIKTQNPVPKSLNEGHERMCKDEKYAFITLDNILQPYISSGCILLMVEHLSKLPLGLAFPHNSPYKDIFNARILKMYENGLLKDIQRKNLPTSIKIETSWVPINELQVLSVILVLLGFMFLSIILLFCEILIHRTIN